MFDAYSPPEQLAASTAKGRVKTTPGREGFEPGPEEQALLSTLPASRRLHGLLYDLCSIVSQEGFLHLGMTEVARRLRCSKVTLYRLAPSRAELFVLVIKLRSARTFDALHRYEGARNWTERLIARLDSLVSEQSKVSFQYIRDLVAFPPASAIQKSYMIRGAVELREILQSGIEAGEFQPVNPLLATQVLSMTISHIGDPDFQASTGLPRPYGLAEALRIFELGIIRRRAKGSPSSVLGHL
jgi:AcrR family transcriptional regulator